MNLLVALFTQDVVPYAWVILDTVSYVRQYSEGLLLAHMVCVSTLHASPWVWQQATGPGTLLPGCTPIVR